MVTLSAKARLFLEAALADPRTGWLHGEVLSLGPDPWSKPLSPYTARVALDALGETEKQIRDRIGETDVDDDEEADLVNDLGFVYAVRSDLQKSLKGS
ncbi:MAG: hypothetical protein ACREE1_01830 [Stellaceae bacterium]